MITEVENADLLRRWGENGYRTEKTQAMMSDITEFLASGYSACEITNPGYKTTQCFYTSLWRYVRKFGIEVELARRGDKVYLLRGDA